MLSLYLSIAGLFLCVVTNYQYQGWSREVLERIRRDESLRATGFGQLCQYLPLVKSKMTPSSRLSTRDMQNQTRVMVVRFKSSLAQPHRTCTAGGLHPPYILWGAPVIFSFL